MKVIWPCIGLAGGMAIALAVAPWRTDSINWPVDLLFVGGIFGLSAGIIAVRFGPRLNLKRGWMQFSLRTLLVAVTLFAAVLGRVMYLHRQAEFHERQLNLLIGSIAVQNGRTPEQFRSSFNWFSARQAKIRIKRATPHQTDDTPGPHVLIRKLWPNGNESGLRLRAVSIENMAQAIHHRHLANHYRHAVYRPWLIAPAKPEVVYEP